MGYLMVMNFDVKNFETFSKYSEASSRTVPPSMKVLAFDTERNDLEGASHERLVILEFPDARDAMHWYRSTEYQTISQWRRASTEGWVRGLPKFSKRG
jgi:uncharacterized protein (DUF1330 family)